jgi:hypothetical protein
MDALSLTPIDEEIFMVQFDKPAIVTLSESEAHEGDVVVAYGQRFTVNDIVLLGSVECPTTVESDSLLLFTVPAAEGGRQPVHVRQPDGTLSNKATLRILPVVHHVEQVQSGQTVLSTDPSARYKPGSQVKLVGSGFAPEMSVRILDEYLTGSDVQYIDSSSLEFKLFRPYSTPRAEGEGDTAGDAGEPVEIRGVLPTGEVSPPITVRLATYKITVFGDSIAWGQGLQEHHKFHSLVEQHIREMLDGTGVYKSVKAHSGATIGSGETKTAPPLPGEINTPLPTILQQVDAYNGANDLVDLVLIDGGINDVGVEDIVNPFSDSNLVKKAKKHCHDDMKELLTKVTAKFKHAQVVVTGYYQIVSKYSDIALLDLFCSAVLVPALGPLGWLVGNAVSDALVDEMAERSALFEQQANAYLKTAVEEVNSNPHSGYEGSGVYFAKPSFGDIHAIFAPDSRLWGLHTDLSPCDTPAAGGVAPERADACSNAPASRLADGTFICQIASCGHPNVRGAEEYARVVIALLNPV